MNFDTLYFRVEKILVTGTIRDIQFQLGFVKWFFCFSSKIQLNCFYWIEIKQNQPKNDNLQHIFTGFIFKIVVPCCEDVFPVLKSHHIYLECCWSCFFFFLMIIFCLFLIHNWRHISQLFSQCDQSLYWRRSALEV